MNLKTFIFWTGVGIAAFVVSQLILDFIRQNRLAKVIANRGEIGFHAALAPKTAS